MKGGRKALALSLSGLLLLAGCQAPAVEVTPPPAPTAVPSQEAEEAGFALPCYPTGGFHPITGENRLNLTLAPLLYRGLFTLDRAFQPQNDLCQGWEVSDDGLVWTFRLQEAAFSDGSPLTAAEAAASLNTARASRRYGGRLADVSRVTARDGLVEVDLFRPNGALPALLDIPIVKETEDPLRPLGTGPYVLTEGEEGLALTARPGAEVPLATIPLRTVTAGDDLVYAFDAKEISLVDVDLTGTDTLGYSGQVENADYPTTTLLYIGCNLRKGLCREEKVRQALGLALDREKMVGRQLAGHAVASALPVHPNRAGYDPQLAETWGYDAGKAAALLEEAGWKAGEGGTLLRGREALSLRLVVNQENTYKAALAETVAEALKKLGCAVTVDKLPWETFLTTLERGEFDLFLGETALTADFDLEPLLGWNGALNYGGFFDPDWEERAARHREATGKEWETTLVDLCAATVESAPILPICFKNGSLLTRWGQVSGAAPVQRDVFAGMENWVVK